MEIVTPPVSKPESLRCQICCFLFFERGVGFFLSNFEFFFYFMILIKFQKIPMPYKLYMLSHLRCTLLPIIANPGRQDFAAFS